MPTFDNIEEYLAYVEEYFFYSVNAVTHSLPDVNEVVNQLWVDISRYGPGMPAFPDVHVPSLGDFQVPPPPPPPPPEPSSWVGQTTDWVARHPWKTSGLVAGIVGAGLLVGYRDKVSRRAKHIYHRKKSQSPDSLQIVGKWYYHIGRRCLILKNDTVILGGDTPYGLPLILDLEKKGYIVIASVSTPEAVEELEQQCHGYVKAHVLDPFEVHQQY